MKDIPRWAVIGGGAAAVVILTYGKRLGMDINDTTLTMLAGVAGTLANFLGKSSKSKDDEKTKDEEDAE